MSNCPACGRSGAYNSGWKVECLSKSCQFYSPRHEKAVLDDHVAQLKELAAKAFPATVEPRLTIPVSTTPCGSEEFKFKVIKARSAPKGPRPGIGPNPCGEVRLGNHDTCSLPEPQHELPRMHNKLTNEARVGDMAVCANGLLYVKTDPEDENSWVVVGNDLKSAL